MNVDTFMTIMSFGLACFMAGGAYGKDHGNKKKKEPPRQWHMGTSFLRINI